ncbi:MBL fold metallo-hydrolase [Candidatus Peregrinibacteria bacterium]|nr:MAG: MBL fold metallo-hydrolase [Candidatus Peregrinibacteria bacterium]
MQIHFHGAAGGVTGSKHIVEVRGKKILLDCGMYQGQRTKSMELNKTLPFNPQDIDAVLLSHAHIDHSGLLPLLVKNGYMGNIWCTPATADILTPMLLDAAHIQEADAQYFLRKKHLRETAIFPIEPLYTTEDAQTTLTLVRKQPRGERLEIFPEVFVTFLNAGHVLGSAQIVIEGDGKIIAFTGDYGRKGRKIIRDPDVIPKADVIISESTYGGRFHEPVSETLDKLATIINDTAARGGKIIIPSFALERTQEILYDLHILFHESRIPEIPVFVDSPLATKFTEIFEKNESLFDEETREYFTSNGMNPFTFSSLHHTNTTDESKALNSRPGPFIVISASGMCEAGRIRHHLKNSISDPKNTILIVGYMAQHTLGRKLVEKFREVKIFDQIYPVRAEIRVLNGLSGHGDQEDLLRNINGISGLQKVFLVHGDPDQSNAFKEKLQETRPDLTVTIPVPGETAEV